MLDTYTAKPIHLVYPLLLFAAGVKCFFMPQVAWGWIGIGLWVCALLAAAWIVIAGIWAERTKFYDSMASVIDAASKTDINKLAALGWTADELPSMLHVDLHEGSRSRHFDLPVTAAQLGPLAAGLLKGRPISEREWVYEGGLFTADEFRRLRAVMRDKGLIEPTNSKDNRQGFQLTPAGHELMLACVSSPPPLAEMPESE